MWYLYTDITLYSWKYILFSGLTSIAAFLLTREVWNSRAGLLAACFIAIVPGYISRSVAGSYDNEGIAIFALLFTYFLWLKSVKTGSVFWATTASLSYFYMVRVCTSSDWLIPLLYFAVLTGVSLGRLHLYNQPHSSPYICSSPHGTFLIQVDLWSVSWSRDSYSLLFTFFTQNLCGLHYILPVGARHVNAGSLCWFPANSHIRAHGSSWCFPFAECLHCPQVPTSVCVCVCVCRRMCIYMLCVCIRVHALVLICFVLC